MGSSTEIVQANLNYNTEKSSKHFFIMLDTMGSSTIM
jgi:hypothetical protein